MKIRLTHVLLAGSLSLGALALYQDIKWVTYTEAVRNPKLRERYIEQVQKQEMTPSYTDAVYFDRQKLISHEAHHEDIPKDTEMITFPKGERVDPVNGNDSSIIILDRSFEGGSIKTDKDFRFIYRNHELRHAELIRKGIPFSPILFSNRRDEFVPNKRLYGIFMELDGIQNHVNVEKYATVSDSVKQKTHDKFMENYTSLWEIENPFGFTDELRKLFLSTAEKLVDEKRGSRFRIIENKLYLEVRDGAYWKKFWISDY